MVVNPKAYGYYNWGIDVEQILASEGRGWWMVADAGAVYSVSDSRLHRVFPLKDIELWSGVFL